jgi:diguanylate cyclase (GGDEF)-like protein
MKYRMPDLSLSSGLPPLIQEKLRQLVLYLSPTGILVMGASWWQNGQLLNASRTAQYGLPLLILVFAVVWTLALRRSVSGQRATFAFTVALCGYLCLEQWEHSRTGFLYKYGDPGSFGWMFVMYLLTFIALDTRRARWVSLGFVELHALIYFSGVRRFHPSPEIHSSFVHHFASSLIAICIFAIYSELKQHLGLVESLAATDPLTGLINRRQMQLHLEQNVLNKQGFILLLLDIDHFKQVNDLHGHNTGDAVLRELSRRLRTCLRQGDFLGRWGGEEFILLLPQAESDVIDQVAQRLLSAVRDQAFPEELSITVSIGGASYLPGERPEDTVHRADTALYQAKQAGRDRFLFYEPLPLDKAA